MIGGLVIILVVGGVTVTIFRYAREIAQTRDEVQVLNATLEQRVKDRTADLARARDKAEASAGRSQPPRRQQPVHGRRRWCGLQSNAVNEPGGEGRA